MKLATIFSGIGSIEYALKRLSVEHEIVFACDNGNIDLGFEQEKVASYLQEVRKLSTEKEKNDYVRELYKMLSRKTNFVEKTYLNNYQIPQSKFYYDVKLLDGEFYRDQIDLLVGGSPCQSFSVIGERLGLEDTRGTLFYDFARIVDETKPKCFIYENVYGLLTHDKGRTWTVMQKVFESLGYFFKFKVLDARNFNIPQGRRRIFVVGFQNKKHYERFEFPKEKELQFTMQDFLIDNTEIGGFNSVDGEIVLSREKGNVEERYFLSEKLKNYVMSPGTKNFMHPNAKTDLEIARAILSTQGNSHRASVNNYVTTNNRLRALHPRESLRLMGYTDDFIQTVSVAQSYKQSGNSIVVDVMMNIYKEIEKAMDGWC